MSIHHHAADLWAASHLGVITLDEARLCGLTDEEVRGNVESRRWTRVVRGVFRDTGAPQTWQQKALLAVKAGPPGAVASHLTAAALFEVASAPSIAHITVSPWQSGRSRIARVHRALLSAADRANIRGVPVVSPARVGVDVAEVLGAGDVLEEILDSLLCRKMMRPIEVQQAIERASLHPGRKGLPALTDALAPWFDEGDPDSVPEMKMVRRLLRWGFPPAKRQLKVFAKDGRFLGKIDIGWREFLAGVEYDGALAHAPRRWVSDQAREEAMEDVGYRLVRANRVDLRPTATRVRDELMAYVPLVA